MRKALWTLVIGGVLFLSLPMGVWADPMDDLIERFTHEYEAIEPPSRYSSVRSDYKLGQAALGTFYTTQTLGLLYRQNQQLLEKYDEMLLKYDQIIQQNKEIIRILSVLAGKSRERTVGD